MPLGLILKNLLYKATNKFNLTYFMEWLEAKMGKLRKHFVDCEMVYKCQGKTICREDLAYLDLNRPLWTRWDYRLYASVASVS